MLVLLFYVPHGHSKHVNMHYVIMPTLYSHKKRMHPVTVILICKMLSEEYQYEMNSKWRMIFLKSRSDHITDMLKSFNGPHRS